MMPKISRRHSWRAFGIIAAICVPVALAAIAWLLVTQARQAENLRHDVETTYERRLVLEKVLSLHQDIETSTRGYALTGNPAFLEPYRSAWPQIDPMLAQVDRLDGDTEANSRLKHLRALSISKRAFGAETIMLCNSGRVPEALARIRSGEGKRRMDLIRGEIGRLERTEAERLGQRSAASEQAQRRMRSTALVVVCALMALLALAAFLILRTMRQRERALDSVIDLSRRRKAILDAAMDGIFILNPSGSIEQVNRSGARMFGYAEEELLRRDVGILFATSPPIGQVAAYLRSMNLREGEPGNVQEIPGRCKDGSSLPADVAISAVALTDGVHYVAIVRDISERKKVDRIKAEFVASVSHELRTPLTSIAGSLGLLAAGTAGTLPERADRLVSIARSNADRLVRLINDILDIEKIDAGKMVFENRMIDLRDIVDQAIEANRGYADRLGVTIGSETDDGAAIAWADPDRVMQVLANLISNAAKFSPRGEQVTIQLIPGQRMHRISICDRGPGIDPEFAGRIFNRFAQADSSDARQKGGAGLGLAIVREIATRLGGRVSYDSRDGGGSRFHIDLPAAQTDLSSTASDRLLVCEHDPAIASAIAAALAQTGFTCDVVPTAAEAARAASRTEYRVILVDTALPGGGGIDLVRSLRESVGMRQVPILMISAEADEGQLGAEALQIAEWLGKPVSPEILTAAVEKALARTGGPAGAAPRVLHVEDDPDILRVVAAALEGRAVHRSASSVATARALIRAGGIDLAILDLGLSDGSGLELLPDLGAAQGGPIPVVVFSAQDADPEVAARVQGYLTKSHTPIERLVRAVVQLAGTGSNEESRP